MTKFVAVFSLVVIQIGVMLGNYWFTFGLWPRSWGAFIFFGISSIAVALLLQAIKEEMNKAAAEQSHDDPAGDIFQRHEFPRPSSDEFPDQCPAFYSCAATARCTTAAFIASAVPDTVLQPS